MSIEYDEKLSVRTPAGLDMQMEIAGVGGRSLAFLIDWHLRFLLALAWFLLGGALYGAVNDTGFLSDMEGSGFVLTVLVPAVAIYGLWHPVLEVVLKGETPGKRWTGIRTVTLDGRTPSPGPLLIRNLFRVLDSLPTFYVLGLAFCAFTRQQIRLGDIAAGTLLVYRPKERSAAVSQLAATGEGGSGAPPRVAELAGELLDRWDELELVSRHRIARELIATHNRLAGGEADAPFGDRELRDRLTGLAGRAL